MKFIKDALSNARETMATSLFFTAMASLLFNPLQVFVGFKSFNRVFGHATVHGIDASARISHFTIFNLIFVPLCFAMSAMVCYWFTQGVRSRLANEDDREKAFRFLDIVSLCALSLAAVFVFNKYNMGRETLGCVKNYGIHMAAVLIFAVLAYIKRPFISFDLFRNSLFASLGLTLFVNFLFQSAGTANKFAWMYFGIIFAIITALVPIIMHKIKMSDIERLKLSFVPLSFGMLFAGLSLEFCNILNQHNVFIENRLLVAKLIYGLFFGLSALLYIYGGNKFFTKLKAFPHWETVSFIGLLVSLYYFTVLPSLQIVAGTELFEQANHGMLVNDALVWGKTPIVNSFDGHMLMISLGQLVYGLFNGDVLGAAYFGYNFVLLDGGGLGLSDFGYKFIWFIPTIVCMFFIYRHVLGKDFAFFLMLIAPAISTLDVRFGVVSILAMLYAVRKQTFGAHLCLLFSVVLSTLYEAPTGLSYGGGALLIAVILLAVQVVRERKFTAESRAFVKAFGVFAGIMVVLWTGLCLIQDVHPIKRALEFIGIAQSTNNWTYSWLGDNTSVTYSLLYSILPLLVVSCLIWLIVRFQKTPPYLVSAAFLVTYILHFTRMLSRHSLAENVISTVIYTGVLGIVLFLVTLLPKCKHAAFVLGILVTAVIFNPTALRTANSTANAALIKANSSDIYQNGAREKTTRVDLSAVLDKHKEVLNMINAVIPEGETFIDLSSQTMLYALSGREKPVYINQSPLHLSGEYTQERFIEQAENYNGTCDFALMLGGDSLISTMVFGQRLDGIENSYRYYKVYEYLYENFRPLCKSSDNFALWVRKDRYEEFYTKIAQDGYAMILPDTIVENQQNDSTALSVPPNDSALVVDSMGAIKTSRISPINYGYLGSVHTTDLGQIPYVWGQYDNKKSWNNAVVKDYASNTSGELPAEVQRSAKYALVTVYSPVKGEASLSFQNLVGEDISVFNFSLLPGHRRYIVRVSTHWWWNSGKIKSFSVSSDVAAEVRGVAFLVGD